MYYDGNAIYQYIREKGINNLKYTPRNVWQLVYADKDCVPKLFAVVSSVQNDPILKQVEKMAGQILKKISDKTEIPLISIRFNGREEVMDKVKVYTGQENTYKEIDLQSLKELIKQYG